MTGATHLRPRAAGGSQQSSLAGLVRATPTPDARTIGGVAGAGALLAEGRQALAGGDWAAARGAFESALESGAGPDARDGLAVARWWQGELLEAQQERQRAYRDWLAEGRPDRAAAAATWLAREQLFLRGDSPAATAWFTRAESALDAAGPCVERGWFSVLRASVGAAPEELAAACAEGLAIADAYGDVALATLARCFGGSAMVALGDVAGGLAQVDEALVAVTAGEVEDAHVAGEVLCAMLALCLRVGDHRRALHWCDIAAATAAGRTPSFVSATCRTTYGEVLGAVGDWQAAETELRAAVRTYEAGHAALRFSAVAKLADLCVRQGRLEEADAMIGAHADHPFLQLPLGRLRLARGERAVGLATLRAALPADTGAPEAAPVLALLVEALTAGPADPGELTEAHGHADALTTLAATAGGTVIAAEAALARARVLCAEGDRDHAASVLAAALDTPYDGSWLAGRLRLQLALCCEDSGAAIAHARAALAVFERLDARPDADRAAALLRAHGAQGHARAPATGTALSKREAEVLELVRLGLSNPEIAQRLWISVRTAEHHVSNILTKLGLRNRTEAAAHPAGANG